MQVIVIKLCTYKNFPFFAFALFANLYLRMS